MHAPDADPVEDAPLAAPEDGDDRRSPAVAARGPELGVALFLMVLASFVVADSVRAGIGWADDGPRAGYFPFAIGTLLFCAAGWVFATTLRSWRTARAVFSHHHELAGVWAMAWPTAVYVAAMPWLGLYVASATLIAYFMRRHGRYGWPAAAATGVGVALIVFVVFERWFLVPLPKGPLERALGF